MPTVVGTSGNDSISDRSSQDDIQALAGNDIITVGYLLNSLPTRMIDGGSGFDEFGVQTEDFRSSTVPATTYASFSFDASTGRASGVLDANNGFAFSFAGMERYSIFVAALDAQVRTGAGNDFVTLRSSRAVVDTGSGNDIIWAYTPNSADRYDGGAGDDTIIYFAPSDSGITTLNVAGIETIQLFNKISYNLALVATGGGAVTVEARFIGANNTVYLDARATTTGQLIFYGSDSNDTVYGSAGNDLLAGNGGANLLAGGAGDDAYVVSSLQDVIQETPGAGSDLVYTSISYTLTGTASIETFSTQDQQDTAALNLIGNGFAQKVIGNFGNNVLNGNGGADTLIGLRGDDIYAIADASAVIVENPGEGYDIVYTQVGYTLTGTASIEELSFATQADTTNLNIIGNAFDQKVIGNFGNNVLNGNGGIDTLIGLRGDDTYVVGDARSVVVENAGEGNDTVYASVSYGLMGNTSIETLSTQVQGGFESINLSGNAVAQTLIGNYGNNVLDGGAGADTLIGLYGDDVFSFSTPLGSSNIDTITDYGNGADRILLDSGIFSALRLGTVTADAIAIGAAAVDGDDRIIYDPQTGALSYDADGSGAGAAVQFATLSRNLAASELRIDVGSIYSAAVSSPRVVEGNSGTTPLVFTVTLNRPATTALTLNYGVISGGTAGNGPDYTNGGGTITFAPGQTIATITLSVLGDTEIENDETVLMQVSGAALASPVIATGVIVNDDVFGPIFPGGVYLLGTVTGVEGVALYQRYPRADSFVFENGTGQKILYFGPESARPGHPTVSLYNDATVQRVDFSQLGQAIVHTGPDAANNWFVRTASGEIIANLSRFNSFTIVGSPYDDVVDRGPDVGGGSQNRTFGGAGNDVLVGGSFMDGGIGNDRLIAGRPHYFYGPNVMTGGEGSDTFVIKLYSEIIVTAGSRAGGIITDFSNGEDRLELSGIDMTKGVVNDNAFFVGKAATTADHRLIYDQSSGTLWFDSDGSGSARAQVIAELQPGALLTASSITII